MAKDRILYKRVGEWSIEYRTRNNHPGYKVWILRNDREIMSYDERNFRQRDGGYVHVPDDIRKLAHDAWLSLPDPFSVSA